MGCCGDFFEKAKPYIAMISLQFGYAGMNVITKVSLNHGMSHYVLVVYRHAFATISIAPFALLLERKVRPKMTWPVFLQIFVLALLGPVIDQNFYYAGLKFTGPTFACAMSNILPAMTFVMAVIFRMEKVDLKKVRCQAKVAGTLVTVAGAMMMTMYKGPLMQMAWTSHVQPHGHGAEAPVAAIDPTGREWFLGSLFVIIATLAWASLFILQAHTLKQYSAPLSLTTLICFVGTLQAIVVTFAMEHRPSVWTIGFDMNLLAAAYAGIVTSSIAYYVQGLVIQKTGPVFASAFSPLMMIVVAVMGSFILAEKIYLGAVLGAVLIVMGLYSVLWGKHKETQEKEEAEAMELPVASKGNGVTADAAFIKEITAVADDAECTKANGMKSSSNGCGVEVHPHCRQNMLRRFCKEKGIQLCAYSPLGGKGTPWGNNAVMDCPVLNQIAQDRGKTVAQVCLRWVYEQGDCVIVKSFNERRMRENLDIFDWELTGDDHLKISAIPECRGTLDFFVHEDGPYKTADEFWDGEITGRPC